MLENLELFGNSLGVGTYPDGEGKSFLQNIFDVIHPIGETYIQYPAQKTPQEIYNKKDGDRIIIDSVWEEQLQYNSAFFRSEHPNTYAYKAAGEEQYYDIDNNNNLTPIKVTGNNDITVADSPTSGQQKIVDGKTYQAYAITGINTSSNPYIIEMNGLSKQDNQNKYHNHSGSTGGTNASLSINYSTTGISLSSNGAARFSQRGCSGSGREDKVVKAYDGNSYSDSSGLGVTFSDGISGGQSRVQYATGSKENSGSFGIYDHSHSIYEPNYGAGHSHGITQSVHSHTISYDGDSTYQESRPDNYTIRIWKRIS